MAGGAIDMMNKSLKNNKSLLGKRKSLKELYYEIDAFSKKSKGLKFKKGSPEFMIELRKSLKRQYQFRIVKSILALFASIATVSYFAYQVFIG